jgi:magnesium chelatase family protein
MLVAAMTLCPCGRLGDPRRSCSCSQPDIESYRQSIPRSIMEIFVTVIEVPKLTLQELKDAAPGETSRQVRLRLYQT